MTLQKSFIFLLFFFASGVANLVAPVTVYAANATDLQSQINTNNQLLDVLQTKITEYQKQLDSLGVEKNTLQSAINTLTLTQKKIAAQIKVTQNKISSANLQIKKLSQSIGDKEATIVTHQNAIAKALRRIAEGEEASLVTSIISAHSLEESWKITDEAMQFNEALTASIHDLRNARTTLTENRTQVSATKATLVSLQNDLTTQQRSVIASQNAQQSLLKQTRNQESTYQKLLAEARAELASFSTFTTNAGGSKLLANQTSCDSWGCYYSQRDTLWGTVKLNGARSNLASEGCLVTSMAMLLTHYGHRSVTPVTINANSGNFSPFGGLLLFTINVDGATVTRVRTLIDSNLAAGTPVVVGVHAYGGTHYVVLTSGSKGKYLMRDPYVKDGKDISLTDHYPVSSIFSIMKVSIK